MFWLSDEGVEEADGVAEGTFLNLSGTGFEDAKAIASMGLKLGDEVEERRIIARRRNRDIFNRKRVEFGGLRHWDVVRVAFKRGRRKGQCFLGTVRAFVPGCQGAVTF